MHGRHHALQDGVEELPGLLRVAVRQQFHRALEVGKQHGDPLALPFQGAFGNEDLLGQIGWGVREGGVPNGLPESRDSGGSRPSVTRPDQAAPRIVADLWVGVEQLVPEIGEGLLV
jgi:hypothetical protein